jgi:hypothetical protein
MKNAATQTLPAWPIVLVWAALILFLNTQGVFSTSPDRPPLPLLIAVLAPPLLFSLAYASSSRVRMTADSLDVELLTAIQAWRLIGAMFLVLMSLHILPGTFAWPAGVGDIIVGAYAPYVVVAIGHRAANWRRHAMLLNILGLIDFVGAIGGGVLSGRSPIGILRGDVSTDIMQTLPLSLIPTFAVPFWIVLHIISLIQLRKQVAA